MLIDYSLSGDCTALYITVDGVKRTITDPNQVSYFMDEQVYYTEEYGDSPVTDAALTGIALELFHDDELA